jgi:hypothetical protein
MHVVYSIVGFFFLVLEDFRELFNWSLSSASDSKLLTPWKNTVSLSDYGKYESISILVT